MVWEKPFWPDYIELCTSTSTHSPHFFFRELISTVTFLSIILVDCPTCVEKQTHQNMFYSENDKKNSI